MWALLALLPLALATPFIPRQAIGNTNRSNSTSANLTNSASVPTVTIYPSGTPVALSGVAFPQYGQDVYLGLPFAAPPVGHLRFVPPQNATYNSSTFSAQKQAPACLQDYASPYLGNYGQSEDCLYLNVYTPQGANSSVSLPVMVWVYVSH